MFSFSSLFADTIQLKNGTLLTDIKTELSGICLHTQNSLKESNTYPLKELEFIQPEPLDRHSLDDDDIRAASYFLSNSGFQLENPKEKPILAILQPNGLKDKEAQDLTNTLTGSIQEIGVFQSNDNEKLNRELKASNCKEKDCLKILKALQIDFIMIYEVEKLKEGYVINTHFYKNREEERLFSESAFIPFAGSEAKKTYSLKVSGKVLKHWKKLKLKPEEKAKTQVNYLLRSALLPGWGQYSKGETWKSVLFFTGTLYLAYTLYNNSENYNTAKNNYNSQSFLPALGGNAVAKSALFLYTANLKDIANHHADSGNQNLMLLLGIYALNLFDAHYSPVPRLPGEKEGICIQYLPQKPSFNFQAESHLGISYSFKF